MTYALVTAALVAVLGGVGAAGATAAPPAGHGHGLGCLVDDDECG